MDPPRQPALGQQGSKPGSPQEHDPVPPIPQGEPGAPAPPMNPATQPAAPLGGSHPQQQASGAAAAAQQLHAAPGTPAGLDNTQDGGPGGISAVQDDVNDASLRPQVGGGLGDPARAPGGTVHVAVEEFPPSEDAEISSDSEGLSEQQSRELRESEALPRGAIDQAGQVVSREATVKLVEPLEAVPEAEAEASARPTPR